MKMKTTMKTILTILLVSIMVLITACQTTKTNTVEVAVLMDITEQYLAKPNSDDILKLYDFKQNLWNGGVFRLSDISHVSLNPTEQINIEPQNQWLNNKFQREKEIEDFQKKLANIVNQAVQTKTGKNNSSVYLPIADELNQLRESKATKKILLVYSDLMENTNSLSFYNNKDFKKLKTKPDEIQNYFETMQSINSLSGIEVYFIYQPTDIANDEQFRIISGFYKKMLESKGAKVTISANLNI